MRRHLTALTAVLPLLALSIGSSGAQEGRTTKHLVANFNQEVKGVALARTGGAAYFLAGEEPALYILIDGTSGGNLYREDEFLGVLHTTGSGPSFAVASNQDGTVAYEIDSSTGSIDDSQPIWSKPPLVVRRITDFANQPASSFIAIENRESNAYDVVDLKTGDVLWSAGIGADSLQRIQSHLIPSPDGSRILACQLFLPPSSDGSMRLFRQGTAGNAANRANAGEAVTSVSFSPDGDKILYSYTNVENAKLTTPARVRIIDGNDLTDILTISDDFTSLRRIGFSPDGSKLGVLTGPDFRVYDVATGLRLDFIPIPNDDGLSFDFNADGTKVAIWTQAGKLDLIDLILVPPMTQSSETQQ